ncbi:uncharacterized protein FMAN_05056 [Fusarium mangiferae]|uniref:Uncharacterized protein n=1 Tax=Fusarium mangiferae TaxID=192010 RepID=A0A1L7SR96_FUSMA|nr:uncharacterized protein FMAN_05056 [Fusarium mangiferae]CVK88219.1 uncharacterized protein FMAN_05056 [Fusarium mangiferae]
MESEAALGTLPAASIGELESQDLRDQLSNDVIRSFGVENGNALHISIDDHPITLPLFSPEEIFTNPSTYSREETIDCLQRGIGQFWADDLAAQQMDAGTNMQNPPQEQNSSQEQSPPQEQSSPHAPSATPEVKPIPQAKARGVKRTRASEPESRAAKRPGRRKRQPATKEAKSEEPRRLRKLLPKPPQPKLDQPCAFSPMAHVPHQQEFQANGRSAYGMGAPALVAANPSGSWFLADADEYRSSRFCVFWQRECL